MKALRVDVTYYKGIHMLKLARNHDGTYDLLTDRGVVLLHEESHELCAQVRGYLDGTAPDHIFDTTTAYRDQLDPICCVCGHARSLHVYTSDAAQIAAQLRGDDLA